jgi:hypothetical protein
LPHRLTFEHNITWILPIWINIIRFISSRKSLGGWFPIVRKYVHPQLKCIAPMNISNGGRHSKREIHYQFLKREKDPDKTLNKYFVP